MMGLWNYLKRKIMVCFGCRVGMPPDFFSMVPGCTRCEERYSDTMKFIKIICPDKKMEGKNGKQ